jgi:anti-anti-sigma regulatory factor
MVRFDGAQLSVEVVSSRFRVIRMAGVLGDAAVARLAALVEAQLGRGCVGHLVIDLGEVSFFATADMGPLGEACELAKEAGVRLHLAGVSAREALIPVAIGDALRQFSTFATVEHAERELTRRATVVAAAGRPASSSGWTCPHVPEQNRGSVSLN